MRWHNFNFLQWGLGASCKVLRDVGGCVTFTFASQFLHCAQCSFSVGMLQSVGFTREYLSLYPPDEYYRCYHTLPEIIWPSGHVQCIIYDLTIRRNKVWR